MILRALSMATVVINQFFSLVGIFAFAALVGSYFDSTSRRPEHTGRIYDCRGGNNEAALALCQLIGKREYHPVVSIYQYPDDAATMVSLETGSARLNFILQKIPVTVDVVNGQPPEPTPSIFSFVQQ
jgi:hypothetical protein